MNAILVAPATERGWSPIGDSLILSSISKLQRDYNVDPERIYMTGQSMGGHLSWRTALTYADRYAAFSPMSGGYPEWATSGALRNLWTTVGFNTWGEIEPYELDKTNVILHDWLTAHSYAWDGAQAPGEHPIASGSFAAIADLFGKNPRKMYRADTWYSSAGLPSTLASGANVPGSISQVTVLMAALLGSSRTSRWSRRIPPLVLGCSVSLLPDAPSWRDSRLTGKTFGRRSFEPDPARPRRPPASTWRRRPFDHCRRS